MRLLRRGMASNLQVGFGLRPGFRQQPDTAPEAALEQQTPKPVDAVADHADGARRTATGGTVIGSQRFGRCPQVACSNPPVLGVPHPPIKYGAGSGAVGQGQQGGHRRHPANGGRCGPDRCGESFLLPAQALEGLETQFDLEAQGVPAGSHPIGRKVGEDDPGFFLLGVPDHQQGATALGGRCAEGGATADPGSVRNGDEGAGRQSFAAVGAEGDVLPVAHIGMPAPDRVGGRL